MNCFKLLSLVLVIVMMTAAAKPQRKRYVQRPDPLWPILCNPSATIGTLAYHPYQAGLSDPNEGSYLVIPFTISVTAGNSAAPTYSKVFALFQWIDEEWVHLPAADQCSSATAGCGSNANLFLQVNNVQQYGPGSFMAALTIYPAACPGGGAPLAAKFAYYQR